MADIYATGAPVSLSFSVSIRMERGRPFSLLAQLEPYHFMPAMSNTPPRYAGIAIKRLSGPSTGISGNGEDGGNMTIHPWELPFAPPIR